MKATVHALLHLALLRRGTCHGLCGALSPSIIPLAQNRAALAGVLRSSIMAEYIAADQEGNDV